ncbi:hypothetical protein AB1K42_15125 [Roseibium algicola]|uniref:Holin n=1 Tax=Roseibium aggregatum (strain ATCC 25650 / DSM 13394 / JCM 20685 / NBRC 16684 / NCIMB 2208 / IAM 12614 / B1) TaxID=384765 RepID=A0NQA9_ROSAI|nr:hypothetical protein [Roseibium aggregatum]EAV44967.1 hypothetical protein SIAM614_13168 [Stappia aggregata IAM 12614] [Roseibium aggregatum IAM 12614]
MVKTYKRETAWALLAGLAALCFYDLLHGGDTAARDWAELFVAPVITFAVAAFGLDAVGKQLMSKSPSPQDYG